MSIGIIAFLIIGLYFFVRAMASRDVSRNFFNVIVDLFCLAILILTGGSVDSLNGYAVLFILSLDLVGFCLIKLDS